MSPFCSGAKESFEDEIALIIARFSKEKKKKTRNRFVLPPGWFVSCLRMVAVFSRRFSQVQVPARERGRLHSLTYVCLPHFLVTVVNRKQPSRPMRDVERNYDRRRGRVQLIRNKFRRSLRTRRGAFFAKKTKRHLGPRSYEHSHLTLHRSMHEVECA